MARFITFEGVDGSGTTTVSERVAEELGARISCEPTNMWIGEVTRESFEERTDSEQLTRFYLFMADRIEHCEKIVKPALGKGETIISDRGPDSTRAYQYHTSDLSEEFIELNLEKSLTPDLTIWFDIDVDAAMGRLNNQDDFEKRDLQQKVNDRYEELYEEHPRIKRVDAAQPIDTVVDDVLHVIESTR